MYTLLRDATIGQVIRLVTGNRLLQYPEERPDFQLPPGYKFSSRVEKKQGDEQQQYQHQHQLEPGLALKEKTFSPGNASTLHDDVNHLHSRLSMDTVADDEHLDKDLGDYEISKIMNRPEMQKVTTNEDLEAAYSNAVRQESLKKEPSLPIVPERKLDGVILVDWYATDDPENPQNWSRFKKHLVVFQIYLYTLAVYIGSAMITPSEPYIAARFGVSEELASMGLSLYVAGYGIGPLLFSPLSEIPIIGRNPPYMVTLAIFLIISIITAAVDNFPALMVLRFLQGFFGSPILATGGATIGDIFSLLEMPYYLTGWAAFATAGPALGPIISGFSVPHTNWHWALWEIVWLAAPVWVSLLFFLPETNAETILIRRARRLRKLVNNNNNNNNNNNAPELQIKSQSEIDQGKSTLSIHHVVVSYLWKPLQINALDPAVLFTSVYTALMYSIFYSFFEVFPFVYGSGSPKPDSPTHGYGMNAGQIGLIFLSISVGVIVSIATYIWYLKRVFEPEVRSHAGRGLGLVPPERRLVPALYMTFLLPIGLFLFAWTGFNSPKIHWIVPTLGIVVITVGIFIIFQCIFIYIPLTYPQYAASLFAGNDFARSSLAAGAIHFSRPMFINLGVGPGVSLLAGLTFGGIIGIYVLYFFGASLRARSRFAI